jgi:hypothetical protein
MEESARCQLTNANYQERFRLLTNASSIRSTYCILCALSVTVIVPTDKGVLHLLQLEKYRSQMIQIQKDALNNAL